MAERQILIVANRTLGGEQLVEAARQRVRAGVDAIWIVVPASPSPASSSGSRLRHAEMVATGTWSPSLNLDQPAMSGAYASAKVRLERAVEQLRALGVAVGGEVGDEDPLKAIGDALARHPSEEILISTLPRAASHWLRVDLPSRAHRKFHIKVSTVSAPSRQRG